MSRIGAASAASAGQMFRLTSIRCVAKAMAGPLTEKTIYTEHGQIIGTPEYMSPEQAEMTNQDIDTRRNYGGWS